MTRELRDEDGSIYLSIVPFVTEKMNTTVSIVELEPAANLTANQACLISPYLLCMTQKDTLSVYTVQIVEVMYATVTIGFGEKSNNDYPIGIYANGKAWISYKNVNTQPPKPILNEEKTKK